MSGKLKEARVKSFEVKRIHGGVAQSVREELVDEQTLTLFVNGERLLAFQCIPEMVQELVVGFLVTEGLVASPAEIRIEPATSLPPKPPNPTNVEAPPPPSSQIAVELSIPAARLREFREGFIAGSSCGKALSSGAGTDPLDCQRKIDMTFRVPAPALMSAFSEFRRRSARTNRPHSIHAAAIATLLKSASRASANLLPAEILSYAEDIGRHNAVDKAVGACVLRGLPLSDKLLFTTGRITSEVAGKALRAGLPLIASTRGPSAAAVRLARDAAIAVIGFVSANSFTLYSAEWRISLTP